MLQNCIRLLTGSSADFLDDYFESDIIKGWLSSSSIIGSKVGPRSQGSGLVLLFHNLGEHDGHFGSWAFHKGGNGGFTQVLARAAQAFGAEIVVDTPVEPRDHQQRPGHRCGAGGRHRAEGQGGRQLARSAAHVHPARRSSGAADELNDSIRRFRFQGTSAKVNFALDGAPRYPGAR